MKLSVMVPTYNRWTLLAKCLDALERQEGLTENFEVVVVDDGSDDGTPEMLAARRPSIKFETRFFRISHGGPAAVRNEGIRRARGELILFIGDDIIAEPRLLEEHLKWHAEYPEASTAVFGFVTWSSELCVTPFMHWLEHGGPGFRYFQFSHGRPVDVLWTCNISLKRDFLLENDGFFDEKFRYAAMEDIELGTRLMKKDLKILYNEEAAGRHYHPTDIVGYAVRQFLAGSSMRLYWEKHPSQQQLLPEMPAWKRALLHAVPVMKWAVYLIDKAGISIDPRVYDFVLHYYFKKGFCAGLSEK